MIDPLLRLSLRARLQLGRFVDRAAMEANDESACRELETAGLIDWGNPAMRDGFPVSEKGWKAWRAES